MQYIPLNPKVIRQQVHTGDTIRISDQKSQQINIKVTHVTSTYLTNSRGNRFYYKQLLKLEKKKIDVTKTVVLAGAAVLVYVVVGMSILNNGLDNIMPSNI